MSTTNNNKLIEFAVKALIVNECSFLALRDSKHPKYELPGGRMEFSETAEETVIREVMEETGLQIAPISLLDTWNFVSETRQITGIIYLCKIINGDKVNLSDEHDVYEWLPATAESFEKMNRLFAPQMRKWDWKILFRKASTC